MKENREQKKNYKYKPECKAVTNESCIQPFSMPRGILPLSQPDVRLVSPMQAAPSFFGLGKNLFLSVEMAANCHPMGFGKNSKQTKRSSFRLNDNRYQCCGIRLDRSMVRSLQVRSLHTEVRSLHSKVSSLHQISYFAPYISYFAPCRNLIH